MRPALRPGVTVWWRRADTVVVRHQGTSRLITGLPVGAATLFRLLDGSHPLEQISALVGSVGAADFDPVGVIDLLVAAGAVYDAGALPRLDTAAPAVRERLLAESVAWTSHHDPAALFGRRQRAVVRVLSTDVLTVAIALQLAASGVGSFVLNKSVDEPGLVEPSDVVPGALPGTSLGTPRVTALRDVITALGSTVITRTPPTTDFALTARPDGVHTAASTADVPYLAASVVGRVGLVGPLVVPGITACVQCEQLTRLDRDNATDDEFVRTLARSPGSGVATAVMLAASHAAIAVLEFIDNATPGRLPALAGHVLTIEVPGPRLSLAAVRPHPRCGCCWDAA